MPRFMLDRQVACPAGYGERNCLLISYRLPFLKHCFILCCEQSAEQDQNERRELMAFFLSEAERLAQHCVGDAQAFMLIHSGRSIRKRSSWHLHVFLVQHRWQKAWVYTVLGIKNVALAVYFPLRKLLGSRQAPNISIERTASGKPEAAAHLKR